MSRGEGKESDYYDIIKNKLESQLKNKFSDFYIEITANKKFSNQLKREINPYGNRDIVFSFLQSARPDITGIIRNESSSYVFIAEIKNKEITLDDIYQTRKYAELLEAKYSLLISTKEIPEELMRLIKGTHRLLNGGYAYDRIALVHYDPIDEDFHDWFEKNPFAD
jgi:hypothetical protein